MYRLHDVQKTQTRWYKKLQDFSHRVRTECKNLFLLNVSGGVMFDLGDNILYLRKATL